MRDGRTVKRRVHRKPRAERWEATLVVLEGDTAGSEHRLEARRTRIGRGPDVDLAFDDDEMSQHHAALELDERGLRVCDLGSTNGTRVNGQPVDVEALEHGDRIACGRHVFQLVVEKRDVAPRTWVLPEDDADA